MSEQQVITEAPAPLPVEEKPPFGMDFRTWFDFKAKLSKKKSGIMAGIAEIPKNGYNAEHDFHYSKESDINDQLRKLFHENGLDFGFEYMGRNYRDNGRIVEVKLRLRLTDCDTGYFEDSHILATGFDTMEKGIYKAYTGGAKYFLMRTFLMSQGDTDPEFTKEGAKINRGPFEQEKVPPKTKQESKKPEPTEAKKEDAKPETEAKVEKTKSTTAPEPSQDATGEPDKKPEPDTPEVKETAADDKPVPVNAGQKDAIKKYVTSLAAYMDERHRKSAEETTYASLGAKPPLREWWQRVFKTKTNNEKIDGLWSDEAESAIKYLEQWLAAKEAKANAK